jgi:hypothetical protein
MQEGATTPGGLKNVQSDAQRAHPLGEAAKNGKH